MHLLNLLALLLLSAGQAFVLVTLVNRSHALPIPRERLRHIRHLHDVLVPLFPIILFWLIGFTGPRLLFGGSWSDVHWGWRVAAQLDQPPIGQAPFSWMLRLPLNEALTVEINTKTLRLPQLPAEWDGVSILHISDWHFMGHVDLPYHERVVDLLLEQEFEMVCFTGDLLDRENLSEWVPSTLGRLTAPLGCCFILGNHDWYIDPGTICQQLQRLGWIDLSGRAQRFERDGGSIVIAGDETPWMGEHPEFPDGNDFRLLLSHTPDNIHWAQQHRVDLMLAGHTHGGQVALPFTGPVYAPSRFGVKYAGGLFWEPPTLMHVSRGLSGRHPLRFRCRPEATRLVLRRG
jgi:uncharacterized protein